MDEHHWQRLDEELHKVARYGSEISAPSNESNTCDWIILPVLWSLGYERHEIESRSPDVANRLPDYTILPNSNETWFLEAKAWREQLSSMHVDQALNYAHSNGQRWVVLTNGREWQLYDDRIPGVSANRLVVVAKLTEPDGLKALLAALTKESISTGGIDAFASGARLRRVVEEQLNRPDSELMRAVVATLRKMGLPGVTGQSVIGCLTQRAPLEVSATKGQRTQWLPRLRTSLSVNSDTSYPPRSPRPPGPCTCSHL